MLEPINRIYEQIESFFLKSDLWIFATVMAMITLIMTLESEANSLITFLANLLTCGLLFLPVFWFIHFRPRLKKQMGKWMFRGLQAFLFLLYPLIPTLLLEIFSVDLNYEDHKSANDFMVGTAVISMSFFGTAVVLFGLLQSRWLPDVRRRISRYLKPTVIFGVFYILAASVIVLASNVYNTAIGDVNDLVAVGIFLSAVVQLCLIHLPYLGLFHIHHKFLYRKLLLQRGLPYYIIGGVAAMLSFTPIHGLYSQLFPITRDWGPLISGQEQSLIAPESYALAAGFLIFSIPVILLLEWVHKTRTISLLQKEKTDTELNLLKQQVNPHFFFNTLNNLYSLSLKQAPETPDTVLQLSELMRYVIYRAKEETVELQEEVKYLKDYLDLQRIRLYQDADIEFTVKMENPELKIPPLLFIILVENAFKHGIEPAVGECFLELKLTETDGEISFFCRNSVEPEAAAKVRSGGIGLQNLNRRLELLYPDEFDIQVDARPEEYCVRLNLWGEALPLKEKLRIEELVPNFA